MQDKIIATVLNFVITGVLGYAVAKLKSIDSRRKASDMALMTLLQSNLTNTYFAYDNIRKIPDYVYKNWLNELKVYESLGGDDYVHVLAKKMESWEIVSTDILNEK